MADKKQAETPEDDDATGGGRRKLLLIGVAAGAAGAAGAAAGAACAAASRPGSRSLASAEAVDRTTMSTRRFTLIAAGSDSGTSGRVEE